MSREQLEGYVGQCLDALEVDYGFDDELQAYVLIDQFGHQISIRARRAAPLVPGADDELFVELVLPLMLKSSAAEPLMWRRLAEANSVAPFVRFYVNDHDAIGLNIDLFAEGFSPRLLASAMTTLTRLAREQGDQMAEMFDGRRAWARSGRRSGGESRD